MEQLIIFFTTSDCDLLSPHRDALVRAIADPMSEAGRWALVRCGEGQTQTLRHSSLATHTCREASTPAPELSDVATQAAAFASRVVAQESEAGASLHAASCARSPSTTSKHNSCRIAFLLFCLLTDPMRARLPQPQLRPSSQRAQQLGASSHQARRLCPTARSCLMGAALCVRIRPHSSCSARPRHTTNAAHLRHSSSRRSSRSIKGLGVSP